MIQVDDNPQHINLNLFQKINNGKYEDIQIKIQKLESTFFQCLSYSKQEQMQQNEKLQTDNSQLHDNEQNMNKDLLQFEQFEKYIAQYFTQLRQQFGNIIDIYYIEFKFILNYINSICFMTSQQLNLFFEEALEQLNNKTKLYQDILKLKLIQSSQGIDLFIYIQRLIFKSISNQNKLNTKEMSIILKILINKSKQITQKQTHHYMKFNQQKNQRINCHSLYPYPNQMEIKKLINKTQLSKKKILNWFINARNSFKRKKQKKQKYKILVQEHYKALFQPKKQSQNSCEEDSNQQILF